MNFDLGEPVASSTSGRACTSPGTRPAGSFDHDRTGNAGTDTRRPATTSGQAPSQAGTVHLWVVLRDDRGGIGWAGYALDVH